MEALQKVVSEASASGRDLVSALGWKNWLFSGSLRAGQRDAAIMSLLHTAWLNGHEPYAYLKDVLDQLPTRPASALARSNRNGNCPST